MKSIVNVKLPLVKTLERKNPAYKNLNSSMIQIINKNDLKNQKHDESVKK
jgi:hypothetical protein